MTYGDVVGDKALKKLRERASGFNNISNKDALDVFARRVKFDKGMGKITLDDLERRKKIKIGKKTKRITILC